jgi:cbb3-type cytochrome oxidase cytochrome c subunit
VDYYTVVIIVTFIAFSALAAALLIPVYRFLKREEADGHAFTKAVKEAADPAAPSRSNPVSDADDADSNRAQP